MSNVKYNYKEAAARFGGAKQKDKHAVLQIEGSTPVTFRILPGNYGDDKEDFFVIVWQHFIKLNGEFTSFICRHHHRDLIANAGEDECPLCSLTNELRAQEKALKQLIVDPSLSDSREFKEAEKRIDILKNRIKQVNVQSRAVVEVYDRNSKTNKNYFMPPSVRKYVSDIMSMGRDFCDPENGYDFIVKKKLEGNQTRYVTLLGDKCPIEGDEPVARREEILAARKNLGEYLFIQDKQKMAEYVTKIRNSWSKGTLDTTGEEEPSYQPVSPAAQALKAKTSRFNDSDMEEKIEGVTAYHSGDTAEDGEEEDDIPMSHPGDSERVMLDTPPLPAKSQLPPRSQQLLDELNGKRSDNRSEL